MPEINGPQALLGPSWGPLAASWAALGGSWAVWAALGRLLGGSWGALGGSWAPPGAASVALGSRSAETRKNDDSTAFLLVFGPPGCPLGGPWAALGPPGTVHGALLGRLGRSWAAREPC